MSSNTFDVEGETKKLEDYWRERNTQIQFDRALINLVKPIKKQDQMQWVSNEPKVFYDTTCALISGNTPRFRLPLTINFEADEKMRMNKAERFLIGVWRMLDERQYRRGETFWLHDFAYWVISGWYAVFTAVVKEGSEVKFVADMFDPMTVYPEWDADGLKQCVRTFEVDRRTAVAMVTEWQGKGLQVNFLEPGEDKVKIINYWRRDKNKTKSEIRNCILVAGQVVKPMTIHKEFDHIPIHVGAVGIPDRGSEGWQSRFGESIIAPNRDVYQYENFIMSLEATILTETAYPNIVTKTQSGAPAVKAEDVRGYGQQIPLRLNETIELLKHAATPQEANMLGAFLARQRQKGSFADTVYGSTPGYEVSGFALSQYNAAIKYKLAPYLNTMQRVMGNIARDFLEQYRKSKFPGIKLPTVNMQDMKKGLVYVEEFKPEDVPEVTYVDVTIPIVSAIDKTQQILFARQAIQPPQLLSRETLWDEVLDVQDSDQEYARIIQDQILELPIMKQFAMIEQLKERIAVMEAEGKTAPAAALRMYVSALEQQLGMGQPGQQQPSKPSGISPNQMPSEAMNSPDMKRAGAGIPPPGVNRPENAGRIGARAMQQGQQMQQ